MVTISKDGRAAAAALGAVLQHPQATKSMDERLFEALLAYSLTTINGFSSAAGLVDKGGLAPSAFRLGTRGYPDVIGDSGGSLGVGIEVKLRSNHNWQTGKQRWQLDVYADRATSATNLFVLCADSKRQALLREFASVAQENPPRSVQSSGLWTFISPDDLLRALHQVVGSVKSSDQSAAALMLALARLTSG
jgi:hypothetical protein